jgi:hypothetical protein
MQPLTRIEVSNEFLSGSNGIIIFKCILGLLAGGYLTYLAVLSFQASRLFSIFIGICGLIALFAMSIYPIYKRNNTKPFVIEIFERELTISYAKKPIPFKFIKATLGDLVIQNVNEGWLTEHKVGEALVLRIEHFNDYFDVGIYDSFSSLFNEPSCFKIPIGDSGISKSQSVELLKKLNEL